MQISQRLPRHLSTKYDSCTKGRGDGIETCCAIPEYDPLHRGTGLPPSRGADVKTSSNGYSSEYSESSFWGKLRRQARPAGTRVVEHALQLFYAARHPDTPAWARAVVYGALGYFILPTDAIPDLIPAVGFSDDFGVLVMAL